MNWFKWNECSSRLAEIMYKTLPNPSLKKLVVKENVGSNVTAHDCMKLANILRL